MSLVRKIFQAIKETIHTHRAPKWAAEPIRRVANIVVSLTATAGILLVAATQWTSQVPPKYRDTVTAWIAGATVVIGVLAKWAGEIARSKVFAPATVANEIQKTKAAALAVANNETFDAGAHGITYPGDISK